MTTTMKAAQISKFGDRSVIELNDIEVPTPGPDDVLIKVKSAGVNPVDWKIREGYMQPMLNHTLPLTIGWDVAGVVEAVGENVHHLAVGDAVYSRPEITKNGTCAEYMVATAEEVAKKPNALSWQQAAGVPLAALTAWQSLYELANLKENERVLIHAGSGAVGQFAIQLAKLRGAYVYTTTSARNTELVLDLGADQAIDYQQEDLADLKDIDVVFDTVGGQTLANSWQTLKQGGRLVSVCETPNEDTAKEHGVTPMFCFVQPNREQLAELAALFDANKLQVNIDSEFTLAQIAQAHERSETGRARGKIIVNIAS